MKRITAIIVALVFVLGFSTLGVAAEKADKCGSCHKGDKALDKIVAKKGIKDAAAFMKAVKEGPTAKMHTKFSDDDIKAAAKDLKLQ
jgi:Spy/CpxP family protein refolding chaperone